MIYKWADNFRTPWFLSFWNKLSLTSYKQYLTQNLNFYFFNSDQCQFFFIMRARYLLLWNICKQFKAIVVTHVYSVFKNYQQIIWNTYIILLISVINTDATAVTMIPASILCYNCYNETLWNISVDYVDKHLSFKTSQLWQCKLCLSSKLNVDFTMKSLL